MQKIKEQYAYKGWRNIIHKTYLNKADTPITFDVVENGDYVTVAAFTKDQEAILVRQFRPGPEQELVSFSEGYIDATETPEQAARRELLEETGYKAGKITLLKRLRTAYSTENHYCLVATDCRYLQAPQLDEAEEITTFTMPLDEFKRYIKETDDPQFVNVATAYLALDHLKWL